MIPGNSTPLRQLLGNSASVLAGAVIVRAASFLTYVLVARYRGAFELGQLALSLTVFTILLEIALFGIRRVIVREVTTDVNSARREIVAGSLLTAAASALSITLAWLFVTVMPYEAETSRLVLVMALALWPAALVQIAEGVAQAWERSHLLLIVHVPVSIVRLGLTIYVLAQGFGVGTVVMLVAAGHVVTAIAALLVVLSKTHAVSISGSLVRAIRLARLGLPFLGIYLIASLRSNSATILVSGFLDEAAVGLFNAAVQLTVPIRLVYENLVTSLFPAMVRSFRRSEAALRGATSRLVEVIGAASVPLVVLIYVFAELILKVLYGDGFEGAAVVARIIVWVPLVDTVKGVLGQALWASNREMITLRVGVVSLFVALVACVALIPTLGLLGAGAAVTTVSLVNLWQHYRASKSAMGASPVGLGVALPLVAGAAMLMTLHWVASLGFLPAIAVACVVYLAVLTSLSIIISGGAKNLRARYLNPQVD